MMRNFFKGSTSNDNTKSSTNPNNANNNNISNSNTEVVRVSSKYDPINNQTSTSNNANSLNAKITNQIIQSPSSHIKPGSASLQHKSGKVASINQPVSAKTHSISHLTLLTTSQDFSNFKLKYLTSRQISQTSLSLSSSS